MPCYVQPEIHCCTEVVLKVRHLLVHRLRVRRLRVHHLRVHHLRVRRRSPSGHRHQVPLGT